MTTGKDLLDLSFKSGKWFKDALAHLNAHGLEGPARLAYLETVKSPAELPLPYFENIRAETAVEQQNIKATRKRQKMKQIKLVPLLAGLLLFGCNQTGTKPALATAQSDPGAKRTTNSAATKATLATSEKAANTSDDKEQIQTLIRKVLKWGDSLQVGLLPGVVDTKKKAITSLNLNTHRLDLAKLRASGLFAAEFIENYNKVILTIDKRLRDGTQQWLDGDQPEFGFYSGVNPWCGCQDVPYDKPNPYDFVEVNVLSKGPNTVEGTWHWGKLPVDADPGWKNFSYKFRAVKENGEWRIIYWEGFDFTEALKLT